MDISNNRLSLLCRNWKLPLCLAAMTYLFVQLSMIRAHLYAVHPACKAPDFSYWTWHVNFIEAISFCVVIAIQIGHLALKIIPLNEFGSYVTTFFVSLLAGISSLIKLCTDWTGNCEDIFGVRLSGELWAEWIACVPFLYFIVLATDTKLTLSQTDFIIIILIAMVFIFGMCVHLTTSFGLSLFLLIATISFYAIGSILFYFETIPSRNCFTRVPSETTERNVYSVRLKNTQIQLATCLLVILPLYPCTYFLSLFRVINHDFTFAFITMLNITAKLIFCTVMNSAHHSVMNEVIRLRLAAETLALRAETAANESRRQFVRYIMHEVRVPLSSITMGLGYLQQCSHNDDNEDESKEALLMMEGATGFMKQTLNDVLNMQRIEEGKFTLDFAAFSIEKAIYRVKATLQGLIKEKQVSLIVAIHPGVPALVIGDGFRIEHVIVNLVSNALKFSQPQSEVVIDIGVAHVGSHQFPQYNTTNSNNNDYNSNNTTHENTLRQANSELSSISIRTNNTINNSWRLRFPAASTIFTKVNTSPPCKTNPTTTTVIFSVIDNGKGISKYDMKTLFLPFSQIRPHELQSGGGSGIGLVICKQIVELHGGTITCQSTLGVGSTFTFSIPFEVVDVVEGSDEGISGSGEGVRNSDESTARNDPPGTIDNQWGSTRPASNVDNMIPSKHSNSPPLTIRKQLLLHKTNKSTRNTTINNYNRISNNNTIISISRQTSAKTILTLDEDDDDNISVASRRQIIVNSNNNVNLESKDYEDDKADLILDSPANEVFHNRSRNRCGSNLKIVPYTPSLPSSSSLSSQQSIDSSRVEIKKSLYNSSNKKEEKTENFYDNNRNTSSDNLLSTSLLEPIHLTVVSPSPLSACASAGVDIYSRNIINHVLLVDGKIILNEV